MNAGDIYLDWKSKGGKDQYDDPFSGYNKAPIAPADPVVNKNKPLIDERLQKQSSLLQKSIQDSFREQRGALSMAAQQTGNRRSTAYSNSLQNQFGKENSVISNIISDTLGKQIGIDEAQKGRDFTADQNELNRALNREQFDRKMDYYNDELNMKKGAVDYEKTMGTAQDIGSLLAMFL